MRAAPSGAPQRPRSLGACVHIHRARPPHQTQNAREPAQKRGRLSRDSEARDQSAAEGVAGVVRIASVTRRGWPTHVAKSAAPHCDVA